VSSSGSADVPERAGSEPPPVEPVGTSETTATTAAAPRKAPRTRTGAAFNTLIAGAIVLILLLVFILENTERVKISYFGAGTHMPLGVALLLAAIGGALLVGIVGMARILQLRRHAKRRPVAR
jgi:uncharacterized integral membrane protein